MHRDFVVTPNVMKLSTNAYHHLCVDGLFEGESELETNRNKLLQVSLENDEPG